MRIFFVGDVSGRSGREALQKHLPNVRDEFEPDVIIVNGENATNGAGITEKVCQEFYSWGVDCITSGNHIWDQREIFSYINRDKKLLRPVNYPPGTPGQGSFKHSLSDGRSILILNAMGRLFMDPLDDPFRSIRDVLEEEQLGRTVDAIFIDFHAETTSEKMSFGHYVDGRVSAVVGTHTHIPTADAHILEHGTAYMTDAGMTGDYNSVIGVRKDLAMHRFVKKTPGERRRPANGEGTLCGVFIETDNETGLAREITPVKRGGVLGTK